MEKTIPLDQREQQMAQALSQRRLQALAQLAELQIQVRQAEKVLDIANEVQGYFLQQALAAHGVTRYDGPLKVAPDSIIVNVPDEAPAAAPAKPNGMILEHAAQ